MLASVACAEEGVTTIKFSDPAKPGTLKIAVGRGDIRIQGEAAAEISVKSEVKPVTAKPRKDGLRVLTTSAAYSLNEKDNVVTLDALSDGWMGAPSDFRVTVPRNTNVVIASSFGGDVTCAGVAGDLEIKNMSGEIRLEDITGGALVETMNGEIRAVVRELHEGKPLSFTSMNGEVVIRVPSDAKANIRMRTQNGTILTDFDDKALVTKTESSPRITKRSPRAVTIHGNDVMSSEVKSAIREAARASASAIREANLAAREALEAAREGAQEGAAEGTLSVPVSVSPVPPMPPIPPISGGKLVTGTLNGGGAEISVVTMNGDVTLRQLEAGK
jgi:hypothetical protein